MTLQDLLAEALERFGNQQAVGQRMGVDRTRISRAMRGEYSFEVVSCLRLARALGRQPGDVLRAAGKPDVADLLDEFFDQPTVSAQEKELLRDWARLPESERATLRALINKLPKADSKRSTSGKRSA